ncbi:hypothetical protein GALMADRAFT_234812 [Galerina marginata CBS 339.88]|uniref:Glycosyl transferase 64 domain-containing protein n=1 Tax=Galerina marginata (strain CBS 339.88) TaxID=685588 RepID=A0A067TR93_GALM3|nr:hypothetical protein GALMADRAFT_234812 [Galerina marginata CBS 339.88]
MLTLFHLAIVVALLSVLSLLVTQHIPLTATQPGSALLQVLTADSSNLRNITVVILNWSRFSNVKKITSNICDHLLEDIVQDIVIWNNNPQQISLSDFSKTTCPEGKLSIINSSENLYFQARYMACAQARTPYCFIQDDDYLVLPEVIRALAIRINEASLSSIHLQPADEMLSSQLRRIIVEPKVHMTFAWLGYGTIITRSSAIEFLSTLNKLQLSVEEHQMADNYFTILSNKIPEQWFDPGIGLGGEQPFTVGTEGEARNNRHILRAAEFLDSIFTSSERYLDLPYVNNLPRSTDIEISRAPCHGRLCIFETSIELLPEILGLDVSVSAAKEILEIEKNRLRTLGEARKAHYHGFPPSNAVDGRYETAFRSPENAKKDDWIMLSLARAVLAQCKNYPPSCYIRCISRWTYLGECIQAFYCVIIKSVMMVFLTANLDCPPELDDCSWISFDWKGM